MTGKAKYPGKTGNVCNACNCSIAQNGSCMCNDPEWNHHTQKAIDPMERTQILEAPELTEEEKKALMED